MYKNLSKKQKIIIGLSVVLIWIGVNTVKNYYEQEQRKPRIEARLDGTPPESLKGYYVEEYRKPQDAFALTEAEENSLGTAGKLVQETLGNLERSAAESRERQAKEREEEAKWKAWEESPEGIEYAKNAEKAREKSFDEFAINTAMLDDPSLTREEAEKRREESMRDEDNSDPEFVVEMDNTLTADEQAEDTELYIMRNEVVTTMNNKMMPDSIKQEKLGALMAKEEEFKAKWGHYSSGHEDFLRNIGR